MHPELLALMQRFELCYAIADTAPPTWLAPQLLPPAKPAELTEWSNAEDLVVRYRYAFLPKGLISRLTVRLHRFVRDPALAWVTGVMFQRDATSVLVEVLPGGNEIELRARGPEHKALLSVVTADLDALNDSFQGLRDKVDKLIPCNCRECSPAAVPHFFEQKEMLRRKEHGRLTVECPRSFTDVNVLELLDGVRVQALPDWAAEPPAATQPRTLRIFLASSKELRADRDALALSLAEHDKRLRAAGLSVELVRWETQSVAMSKTRSQDEYNAQVRKSDLFVSLFFTRAGQFTEEEFDVAVDAFRSTGKPRVYSFFKNAAVNIGDLGDEFESLLNFRKKLKALGHFSASYNNTEDLLLQFQRELDAIAEPQGT